MRNRRSIALLSVTLLGIATCLACNNARLVLKVPHDPSAAIDLRAITGSRETQVFREVARPGSLPKAVLDHFVRQGGIAGPGEDFNPMDFPDSRPSQMLVTAAVSQQYCIVSYWQGGMTLRFTTTIFELTDHKAKVIWISNMQGGLNLRDLKEMVESGRMRNTLSL
jgi:hypothetical protein